MLGSKVRFLLIVFKANLKASSSAPEGPLSMDSNIPPEGWRKKREKRKNQSRIRPLNSHFLLMVIAIDSLTQVTFKQMINIMQAITARAVLSFLTLHYL